MENLKEKNYQRWKIEALGEWVTLGKLVYTNWEERDFDYHDYLEDSILCCGLDFGFATDPTALVCSLVTDDTIYIFKEKVVKGWTNDKIAKMLKKEGLEKSMIIADSAEPKSIEELKKAGIRRVKASKKGPDSIRAGIDKIQQYKIVVHPSCEHVITELENYAYQKDKQSGEYINKPIDDFNHCLDALRYSIQILQNHKRIGTFKKSQIGL
jgi:phage terminase large subunit